MRRGNLYKDLPASTGMTLGRILQSRGNGHYKKDSSFDESFLVDQWGIEPQTSAMRMQRSTI